jgi:hypothetical protein
MPVEFLSFADLKALSDMPSWKEKSGRMGRKYEEFSRLFKSRKHGTPDDLFFEIEDLPAMGKEYWFLHFCAPPYDEQVVFTFGRSVDPVVVNETGVPEANEQEGVVCAAVCWLYSRGKKEVIFDSTASVRLEKGKSNSIIAENKESRISIAGKYPRFDISLERGGKRVFHAHASHPCEGHPYEMVNILSTPLAPRFGTVMINYYFDFDGELDGRKMKGRAYLQKVVAVMPLAPWNWVRLEFKNGDALDFFTGKPFGDSAKFHIASNAYLEIKGKRTKLRGLKLSTWLEGERRVWLLSGKNLVAALESYSMQPFVMRQKTVFQYDEYLVRVKAFAFSDGERSYSLPDLGGGVGIAEEATGYLL